jgi:hypothetical protein
MAPINAEIGLVHGNDLVCGMQLAQSNDAQIGEITLPIRRSGAQTSCVSANGCVALMMSGVAL